MGQVGSWPVSDPQQQQQQEKEKEQKEETVLIVQPEYKKKSELPQYEKEAEELYETVIRPIKIVPPLLRTSVGLPPPSSSQNAETTTLLNSIQQRLLLLLSSRETLMEQEALEEQRHRKQQEKEKEQEYQHVNSETSTRIENNTGSSLSVKLQNYAICWKKLQETAVDKSCTGTREIDCFCVELNKNLNLMEKEATVQSYLMDLCNHYYDEEVKLHDEITEVTKLLQDDVLVLLKDVCSLLSDSERDDISASLEVKS